MTENFEKDFLSKTELENFTKIKLLLITKKLGIKNVSNKNKKDIIEIILSHEDPCKKYKIIPINNNNYDYIYHISDIHIRPLSRHVEYNEVFEKVYNFLEDKKTSNIIAITGDILHEKDNLKPETILLCRTFIKKLSNYGTVVIIAGNHDMLENNSDRLDNLTAIVDDLPVHYLVNSGAYQFGNIVLAVSSLVDKKFIKNKQIINPNNYLIAALYHGTINGSINDIGYIIEDTDSYSTRFRKISDFDGYDMVLLGDIHKHQYLKPNMAYPSSLIQQNFGENLKEHGILEWEIKTKKSIFYPIKNNYGFINIYVNNNSWKLPNDMPEKPYIRLLLKETDNEQVEKIRNELEKKYDLQSFKTKEVTDESKELNLLSEDITTHQDDIDILNEEMDNQNFDKIKKDYIFDIHKKLKEQCFDDNLTYDMNNQNWKILKLSFKNVFIFGENKTNVIDFTNLNGITTIVGPNAIGKSNIINIIIFLLYGSNINFKVPHILNKYQNEYFIECELIFGAKKYKIQKTGKKRKGNKLNHSFSLYEYDNKWVKQDKENNKETSKILRLLLGTVNEFLLTNVYSNSSLRTILTLTNSEKHKALSTLFCLDIYESLEKLAKKDLLEIKKQCLYLEGEQKGLLSSYEENDIIKLEEYIVNIQKDIINNKNEIKNLQDKKIYLENEKEIIFNKKVKCLSKLKKIEEKNFDIISDEFKKYEIDYKDILLKSNIDIEELKSNYYRLEGSLVKIDNIDNIEKLDIDIYEKKRKELILKKNNEENIKESLQKNQETIQTNLNNVNRKIIDISNINVNDNTLLINNLKEDFEDIVDMTIEEAQTKLINIKACIVSFEPDKNQNIFKLPDNYNNEKNQIIIDNIISEIKYNENLIQKNIHYIKDKECKINIKGDTLEERECNFKIHLENLKFKIKNIETLPEFNKKIDIEKVNNKINKIKSQSSFVSQNEIQDKINILCNLKYNQNEFPKIKNCVKETIILLESIKENINNLSIIKRYEKLSKLLKYKSIYYKNIENEKNNKQVEEEINDLYYSYYNGNNKLIINKNKSLKKNLDKYLEYRYLYQNTLYNKCCYLEKFIKYKNYLIEQKLYEEYILKKQENFKIIEECNKYENNLKEIKIKLEKNKNKILELENDIFNIEENINKIKNYNNNNIIYKKMNILQTNINEQKIRNKYNELKVLLQEKNIYNKIKENNFKLSNKIKIYDEMIIKLKNDLDNTTSHYIYIKSTISSQEKELSLKKSDLNKLYEIQKTKNNINNQIVELHKDINLYDDYIQLINKNNIPNKLINKKNKYLQDHINAFLEKLTKFTISIDNDNKNNINFSVNKNGLILDINQLSGYETFILNIALKSALNKYSFISKSTLFILDEGLDVVDKDNFKKLNLLMNLLMKHYKHILLISHMPKVKDLQNNEINIKNNGKSSFID